MIKSKTGAKFGAESKVEDNRVELSGRRRDDEDIVLEMELAFPEAPKDAKDLSSKEVTRELEVRSIRPSGFYGDDVKTLQELFNKEYEEQLRDAQARRDEYYLKKQKEKELEKEREREVGEMREERAAIKAHPKAAFWIKVLPSKTCPKDARISNVSPPLLRALARQIPKATTLLSLDLTQGIIDTVSGNLLAIALCRNTTIRRLELEGCNIGPETIGILSKILEENQTIAHLSLENNPLTGVDRDNFDGFQRFCSALQQNNTLLMLNLWRTGLGIKGGMVIAKDLAKNTSLLGLEVGCNSVGIEEEKAIHNLLERNAQIKARVDLEEKLEFEKVLERERAIKAEEDDQRKRIEEEEWLELRKRERAEAREQAKLEEIQRQEEERRLAEEEKARLEEEERLRQEAKKKKKKKGKGKKGKK